ncbi:ATP-binding protein [Pseudopedobacter sp.]|uniref:ATP-binding protein n=1 Tax=Pseudopedobacter sp. TaxID=1936787 RepID=UPI00333E4204
MIKRSMLMILLWLPLIGSAQSIDSLERELNKNTHNIADKIKIYDSLAKAYRDLNFLKSITYNKLGLELAEKNNDEKSVLKFYSNISASYYRGGIYDTASLYLEKALPLARQQQDYRSEAVIAVTYGAIYQVQSLYNKSLESYLNAAKILEEKNDMKGLCSVYSNIGGIYQILKNYPPALVYFKKAEQLAIEEDNQASLANIYISLSDISLHQNKTKKEPLQYAEKALQISKNINDSFNEASALQMLSRVHYYYGDPQAALPMAQKALQKTKNLGFPNLTAHALIDISNIYFFRDDYTRAAENALESLNTDTTDANIAMNAYANLIQANAYLGHPELTEQYLKSYREVLDRYANNSYQHSLSEMVVKYETEKKELKITALEKQRQLYIWLGIASGILLLFALAFGIIRYRLAMNKRKLAEEKASRLEQEKQLVAVQATLDGEAAERTRLARDLHDGLGSMLSVVKFNLPQVKGGAVLEINDVSRFNKALTMLDDSIQELRRVAHHMMPESLLRYGLKISLTDFCDAIPSVDFHYFGNETRLSEKMEIMVYRCIHELVSNALKHARSSGIHVQLVQEEDRLSFTVQDNGIGFDKKKITEGMGLSNIRQRVEAFNGKMNIYTSNQGTEINVELEFTKN